MPKGFPAGKSSDDSCMAFAHDNQGQAWQEPIPSAVSPFAKPPVRLPASARLLLKTAPLSRACAKFMEMALPDFKQNAKVLRKLSKQTA
jgi:hypothetical protein